MDAVTEFLLSIQYRALFILDSTEARTTFGIAPSATEAALTVTVRSGR